MLILGVSDILTVIKGVERDVSAVLLPCTKNSLSTFFKISIYKPL